MKLPKLLTPKIIFFILSFFLFSGLFTEKTLAFSTPSQGTAILNFENAVFKTEEMNLQSFVYETLNAVLESIWTKFFPCISCTPEERKKNPALLGTVGSLIAGIYASPPASGVQYLAYLGNKLGIISPVYAQEPGIGFRAMSNILPIWKAFRNISYVFFVLILVFIGFAIMFRAKISPQTVITIQSALPRIVLGLILITFSYAIVGFMIDLAYVILIIINNIFKTLPIIGTPGVISLSLKDIFDRAQEIRNIFIPEQITGITETLYFILENLFTDFLFVLLIPCFLLVLLIIAIPIGGGIVVTVIILILILWAFLRVLWTLLKTYVNIIIGLVFAPFQILAGILPGSNAIGGWFKNMLANILVLPTIYLMILLGSYLILQGILGLIGDSFEYILQIVLAIIPGTQNNRLIDPGMLQTIFQSLPIINFWEILPAILLPLVGLIIFLTTPKAADLIKSFLAQKPFPFGTAIGEATVPLRLPVGLILMGSKDQIAEYIATRGYKRPSGKPPSFKEKLISGGIEAAGKKLVQ